MKEKLLKLLNNAYAPYSKYRVAAIVVMKSGEEFSGVNVENASYGATICAERNAVNAAITAGYKKGDFQELYLMVDSEKLAFPCFICRQVLVEFFELDDKLTIMNENESQVYYMKDIIVHPFLKDNLL